MNPRAVIVALFAVTALWLMPAGWGGRTLVLEAARLTVPAALADGSRATSPEPITLHAVVSPAPALLGQRLTYRAFAYLGPNDRIQFAPPEPGGDFTWGAPRTGRTRTIRPAGVGSPDSAWLEMPLQVFRTGRVAIPGLAVRLPAVAGANSPIVTRLPTVHLLVRPTVTANDTAATLRPVHGPLGAPWWERVPWRIVTAALVLLLGGFALVRWLAARRRPVIAPAPVAPARPAVDPAAEALAAVAALRREGLPELGRFGEHALRLTRILRRYLERTLGTPRPGDTSPELIARVRASRLAREDVQRLEGLLGLWDRVKFARAPLDVAEAGRCEAAVESLVRRRESPREVA